MNYSICSYLDVIRSGSKQNHTVSAFRGDSDDGIDGGEGAGAGGGDEKVAGGDGMSGDVTY